MKVLIDGDIVAFMAASVEPLDYVQAQKRADEVIEGILEGCFSDDHHIYVKGNNNFRYHYPTYKSNRSGERPSTLEDIRDYLGAMGTRAHGGEADDYVVSHANRLRKAGEPYVIATIDKDLRQMSGLHYNIKSGEVIHVTEQEGYDFLMQQCLMGDAGDGIPGLKGIGKAKSAKMLDGVENQPRRIREIWQEREPQNWEQLLEETYNLVYIRRELELKVLPLPREFYE